MYLNLIFAAKICFFVKQTDFCTVINYDEMRGACGKREKKTTLVSALLPLRGVCLSVDLPPYSCFCLEGT